MSDSIELKLEGPKLTPDRFEKAVHEFFALIKGVTKNIAGEAKDEDWLIEVSPGSAIVRAKAQHNRGHPAITAVRRGLQSLASGVRTAPQYFTREEIRAARNLATVSDPEGKFVTRLSIQNGDSPLTITDAVAKTADVILAGESQIAFGSFEGTIETFHHKEGQPFTCSLHDPLYKRSIVCSFTSVEAEDVAYRAFRPAKRVLISGLIHYASEGYPVRINADRVRVFPEENELPTVEHIQAIYG